MNRAVPHFTFWCIGPTAKIIDGFGVGRNQPSARASFNGHVADRHAAFDGKLLNGRTGKFDGGTITTRSTDLANNREHDVLGRHPRRDFAVHAHTHVPGLFENQALGGEHMFHFRGTDAEGQRAKGTVRGGVRVAAHHGHTGQRRALLRADDMHNALARVIHAKLGNAVVATILIEGFDLQARHRIGDALCAAGGRHIVVSGGEVGGDTPNFAARQAQAFEGLRAGHFVHQVAVNIKEAGAILVVTHDVRVPELVVQRFPGHGDSVILCNCVNTRQGL